jgi:hypothetical protein
MTTIFGMMAMMPVLFASAGYVLVSSRGTAENSPRPRGDRDFVKFCDL